MRILILSNIFPPGFVGGYELGAEEVARGLVARGHSVEVLTSSYLCDDPGSGADAQDRPVVHRSLDCTEPNRSPHDASERAWLGGFALPRNLRELAGRLLIQRPDAVLCFNLAGLGPPALLQLLVASGLRPVIYLMDNVFGAMCADAGRRRAYERVFSRGSWPDVAQTLFMSQNLRDEVEAKLGYTLPHARIVPGWYDQAAFSPVVQRDDPTIRFVFASRLAGHKGIDILLEACRALRDGGCVNFTVDLFGAGDVAATLQRITAMQLGTHVRYQGAPQKSDLMSRLSGYDALLFPTWNREPFGFVVAEAAVAGCIPIMTAGIGASEWFLDGLDCLKTWRDPAALHAAMLRVVTLTSADRTSMRRRAQSAAERFLRYDIASASIEASLQEANRPPSGHPRAMEAALAVLTEVWRARPHG